MPIASAETLGGVKIGDGVNISEDGKISVPKPVALPFNFGIDENGNYGYIKVGADSVTLLVRCHQCLFIQQVLLIGI